jgi:hypothetical protein
MTTKLRARFDGKVLVPLDPVDLPIDQELDLEVHERTSGAKGSPHLLRQLMREPPHIPSEEVDELERMIEQGKRPVNYGGTFDDEK